MKTLKFMGHSDDTFGEYGTTMHDNPTMTPAKIARTESMFSGVFYERYVLGKWVVADRRRDR